MYGDQISKEDISGERLKIVDCKTISSKSRNFFRIFPIVLTVLCFLTGVGSLLILPFSVMMFDSPNSTTNPLTYLLFLVVMSTPFVSITVGILMIRARRSFLRLIANGTDNKSIKTKLIVLMSIASFYTIIPFLIIFLPKLFVDNEAQLRDFEKELNQQTQIERSHQEQLSTENDDDGVTEAQ